MNPTFPVKGLLAFLLLVSTIPTNAQQRIASTPRLSATKPLAPREPMEPVFVEGFRLNEMESERNFNNRKDLKSKEVSQELSTSKTPEIYIDNSSRNLQIKTWDQSKIKITTTVFFEGEGKLSDEEWFEKLNLSLKTLGSSVRIKSGTISGGSYTFSGNTYGWSSGGNTSGVAVFDGTGQNIGTKSNIKRVVTVYVPAGSKLDIDSKYADIQLTGAITAATIDLTNGNLEAENFNKLFLRSKYSNVTVENVAEAEIDFMNGRFTAKNVDEGDFDTKYATIEVGNAKKIIFRSTNDEYDLEEVAELRGRKNYGNLRITKLNGSLEMDGTNADVKVRSVGNGLSFIKMDNRYGDVRIGLRNIKNYAVNFSGPYSSVYGSFEKQPLKEEIKSADANKEITVIGRSNSSDNFNRTFGAVSSGNNSIETRFSATVGDGKGLKIDMKCQNCTVDFK